METITNILNDNYEYIGVTIALILGFYNILTKYLTKRKVKAVIENNQAITVEEFNIIKKEMKSLKGIYILHNISKDMYYVGQSKNVISRVTNHFQGRGNGDVYADHKYGDVFMIQLVPLANSGFKNLDELERSFIQTYDSYRNGYNRNKGNKS